MVCPVDPLPPHPGEAEDTTSVSTASSTPCTPRPQTPPASLRESGGVRVGVGGASPLRVRPASAQGSRSRSSGRGSACGGGGGGGRHPTKNRALQHIRDCRATMRDAAFWQQRARVLRAEIGKAQHKADLSVRRGGGGGGGASVGASAAPSLTELCARRNKQDMRDRRARVACAKLQLRQDVARSRKSLLNQKRMEREEELLRQLQRAEELAIGRSEVFRWNCAKTKEVRRDRDRLASAKQAHLRKVKCEAQWRNEVRIRHAQEATQVHGCIAHHAMQEHDELQAVLTQLKARTAYDPPHSCWAHPLPG